MSLEVTRQMRSDRARQAVPVVPGSRLHAVQGVPDRVQQAVPVVRQRSVAGRDREPHGLLSSQNDDRYSRPVLPHRVGDPATLGGQHVCVDHRDVAVARAEHVKQRVRRRSEQERVARLLQDAPGTIVRAGQHHRGSVHAAMATVSAIPKNAAISERTSFGSDIELTVARNAAPPRCDLAYQARCLRAMRTPVTGP